MTDRLLNDIDTERKIVHNELAGINRMTRADARARGLLDYGDA